MHFRLRYQQHDLELAEGEFAIGRSVSCQLSLDDPLVSRRHAVFTVSGNELVLEDLGSRNGVLVNGQRIEGQVNVRPGDRVTIGSQELTVLQLADGAVSGPATHATASMPRVTLERISRPEPPPDDGASEEHTVTNIGYAAADADDLSVVRRLDGFRLLGSVADKALAMGRADEAERLLAASLGEVLENCQRGRRPPPALAEQATRFAAKLATATGKGAWVDYTIEIYASLARPIPAVVIDELYGAFRKVGSVDIGRVKAYVEVLRNLLPMFGPADRFLFQRIEGLERLATLRS